MYSQENVTDVCRDTRNGFENVYHIVRPVPAFPDLVPQIDLDPPRVLPSLGSQIRVFLQRGIPMPFGRVSVPAFELLILSGMLVLAASA